MMDASPHILIVEDEAAIARGLVFNFEQEGYRVTAVDNGRAALACFEPGADAVDLLVLDLMLPGMSGYDVCEQVRRTHPDVPVLVLSARTLPEDKVRAFDLGSDQYVTKPFALPELLSRVRRLLSRRSAGGPPTPPPSELISIGEAVVDFATFEVRVGEETHRLTTMEAALLRYFVERPGRVLSRGDLMRDVWSQSPDVSSRSVDNFVMRLRRMLEPDPGEPRYLLSVRGTGYRFEPGTSDGGVVRGE